MFKLLLLINFSLYQPQLKTQRFLDIDSFQNENYKICKSEKCLKLLPFIQFERPEAISANQ